MMTSRERIKILLDKQIPDKMGLFEHYWPETLGTWEAQGYVKDANPEEVFGYDICYCGGWIGTPAYLNADTVVEETDEWRVVRNGSGASLKFWKNKSGTPEHIGFEVDSPEVWAKYREPLIGFSRDRLPDIAAIKTNIEKARSRDAFVVYGDIFVNELLRGTLGDEHFLPAMLTDPDWIKDFCKVYRDLYIAHYDVVFKEAGVPDGFFVYEDLGYNHGLFASPKTLREILLPFYTEWVGFLHSHGIQVIMHSCGNINEAIPIMIEAGVDCLQPMEAKAGCNVLDIANIYGNKLAYMGNMDIVPLSSNNEQLIEAEILPKMKAIKEKKIPYIFHSDHSIPPSMTIASYQHVLKLFNENRSYE